LSRLNRTSAKKSRKRARVTVLQGSTAAVAGLPPFDSAVLINVLEHIDDDDGALRELPATLKPGGRLILRVPALALPYSDFDRKIGHYRRYRMAGLRAQLSGVRGSHMARRR
jgi:2-polyprenyl-3-methyl-5-hydroxy-6-metoxy-1,4-benzoquinol methylase